MNNNNLIAKILWLTIFAIAMAFAESAVVVYLRAIFHPQGFLFPLKVTTDHKLGIEVFRETATIIMLLAVSFLAGKQRWERFAYFMLLFGIWDIFYYVWLKVLIDWPASIFEGDILFLIPIAWIGPVIAPVSISLLMIIFSILIARSIQKGRDFKPGALSYLLASAGLALILYSFMCDTSAIFHQQMPKPYRYELLIAGDALFITAFLISYLKTSKKKG